MPYLVVALVGWNSPAQVRLSNSGCSLSDLADIIEHASGSVEDDRKAKQDDEQPKAEEAESEVPQHTQLVSLRESKVNVASILHAYRRHPKGVLESLDIQVVRHIGNGLKCANGG